MYGIQLYYTCSPKSHVWCRLEGTRAARRDALIYYWLYHLNYMTSYDVIYYYITLYAYDM